MHKAMSEGLVKRTQKAGVFCFLKSRVCQLDFLDPLGI